MLYYFPHTSFPPGNPLRKLFNRSTVKVSSSHNTKLLQRDPNQQQVQGCNCQGGPDTCPLNPAECQKDKVIYVASVESVDGVEHYTSLTGKTFKKRYYKHVGDFRNISGKNNTRLSKYIWKLKEEGKN